jgi:hypothetical protein
MSTLSRSRRPIPLKADWSRHYNGHSALVRLGAATLLAGVNNSTQRLAFAELETRAAVPPATTTGVGWADALAPQMTSDLIQSITSQSAAAALIAAGVQVDMSEIAILRIPGRTTNPQNAGSWITEGAPIPMRAISVMGGPTLIPRKLAVLTAYTAEQAASSSIEAFVRAAISEATGLALDAKMFSTDPSSSSAPGGLLYNVTPIAAATGGGLAAMTSDISALMNALATNGGGASPMLIAAVSQATTIKLFAGPRFDIPILSSSVLPTGTVVVVEPASFISAFSPIPEFSFSSGTTVHEEDTMPLPLVAGGTAASPTRSLFQTDAISLRMILRAAFAMRAKHAQWIQNTTW